MAKSLSKGASTEATAKAEMPPRVLVEMPDGDLTLGEDTGKLAVCEAAEKVKLAQMSAAEGGARTQGSQRYARMMAAQYSLTLQRLLSRRARLFAGPVGAPPRPCAQALHGIAQRTSHLCSPPLSALHARCNPRCARTCHAHVGGRRARALHRRLQ